MVWRYYKKKCVYIGLVHNVEYVRERREKGREKKKDRKEREEELERG